MVAEQVAQRLVSLGYPESIHAILESHGKRLVEIEESMLLLATQGREQLSHVINNLTTGIYPDVAINRLETDHLELLAKRAIEWRTEHEALKIAGRATGALLLGDEPTD